MRWHARHRPRQWNCWWVETVHRHGANYSFFASGAARSRVAPSLGRTLSSYSLSIAGPRSVSTNPLPKSQAKATGRYQEGSAAREAKAHVARAPRLMQNQFDPNPADKFSWWQWFLYPQSKQTPPGACSCKTCKLETRRHENPWSAVQRTLQVAVSNRSDRALAS